MHSYLVSVVWRTEAEDSYQAPVKQIVQIKRQTNHQAPVNKFSKNYPYQVDCDVKVKVNNIVNVFGNAAGKKWETRLCKLCSLGLEL